MQLPPLDLTRFDRCKGVNHYADTKRLVAAAETVEETMADHMVACIAAAAAKAAEPQYWSFAYFKAEKHDKASILWNSAVVLEYPASAKGELMMQLAEIGFAHWLVATDDSHRNMVAVIFPLAAAILNDPRSGRYTRVASCLLKQIDMTGASEGCIAPTFLIRPTNGARVEGFAGEFLDPGPYIAQTAELTAKAVAYVGEEERSDAEAGLFDWPL